MTDPVITTRRELVSVALAAGVVSAIDPPRARAAAAAPLETDAELLRHLLGAELLAVAVYEGVLATGLLSPRPEHVSRRALSQERAHVGLLTTSLLKLGGSPPPSPTDQAVVDKELAARHITGRLANIRTEHDCGSLLLDLESVVMADYFKAMSKLQDPGLQRLAAQIMANEAQHAAAVSEARRPGNIFQAVPYAFAEGRR
jgi:hypothetical protein